MKIAVTSLDRHDMSTIFLWNDIVWEQILTMILIKKEPGKSQCKLTLSLGDNQMQGDFRSSDAVWIGFIIFL